MLAIDWKKFTNWLKNTAKLLLHVYIVWFESYVKYDIYWNEINYYNEIIFYAIFV